MNKYLKYNQEIVTYLLIQLCKNYTPSKLCLLVAVVIDFIIFLFVFAQLSIDASYILLYFSWLFFYLMVKNRFRYEFWFQEETNIETME